MSVLNMQLPSIPSILEGDEINQLNTRTRGNNYDGNNRSITGGESGLEIAKDRIDEAGREDQTETSDSGAISMPTAAYSRPKIMDNISSVSESFSKLMKETEA